MVSWNDAASVVLPLDARHASCFSCFEGCYLVLLSHFPFTARYSIVGRILRKRRAFKKVYVSVTDDALAASARPDYESEALTAMERA